MDLQSIYLNVELEDKFQRMSDESKGMILGVFGVSFKIKGPPKKLKTTVNPIKTLTPRFITRTLEKIKRN